MCRLPEDQQSLKKKYGWILWGFLTFAGESQLFFLISTVFQTLLVTHAAHGWSDLVSRFVSFLIQAWLTLPKNEWLIHQKPWWVFERGTYSLSAPLFRLNLFGRFSGLIFHIFLESFQGAAKNHRQTSPFFGVGVDFLEGSFLGCKKHPRNEGICCKRQATFFSPLFFVKKIFTGCWLLPKKVGTKTKKRASDFWAHRQR